MGLRRRVRLPRAARPHLGGARRADARRGRLRARARARARRRLRARAARGAGRADAHRGAGRRGVLAHAGRFRARHAPRARLGEQRSRSARRCSATACSAAATSRSRPRRPSSRSPAARTCRAPGRWPGSRARPSAATCRRATPWRGRPRSIPRTSPSRGRSCSARTIPTAICRARTPRCSAGPAPLPRGSCSAITWLRRRSRTRRSAPMRTRSTSTRRCQVPSTRAKLCACSADHRRRYAPAT